MNVWELSLRVYLLKNIDKDHVLQAISCLIDKSFLHNDELIMFHNENVYKYYCYSGMYPVEKSKIYECGKIYTVTIRTIDEKLVNHFEKILVNEYTDCLKALTLNKKVVMQKHIKQIYSITPCVAKFSDGYWKNSNAIDIFEKRLKENLIKKYNQYFDCKLHEEIELFNYIEFNNRKPISTDYKEIKILGDKLSLNVSENSLAQELAYFSLATGILEMNSRGFGFVNYKYL